MCRAHTTSKETGHWFLDVTLVQTLVASIQVANTPNINAVAKSLDVSPAAEQALLQYVQLGLDYFQHQLENSLRVPLKAFKAARLFCPTMVASLNPSASDVESLLVFPFLSSTNDLKEELPIYLAEVDGLDPSVESLVWWKQNASSLPAWATSVKKELATQPSSAAAERAFSIPILHLMIIKTTHSKTISRLRSCYSII